MLNLVKDIMKKTNSSDVSIVILSYNVKEITKKCIRKALIAAKNSEIKHKNRVKIIVVDNNSTDGSAEMVRKNFKEVNLIANDKNYGVSVGYNIGMRNAKSDYTLIINSDLYLDPDAVTKAVSYMQENVECDVLICKLYFGKNESGPYGGYLPTPMRTIYWLLGFESVPVLKNIIKKIYGYNPSFYEKDGLMEWAPTCFLFYKKEVFEATGGHDENIFLYMDDLDFCKRIKDNNFKLWYTPKFSSYHVCGASTIGKIPSLFLLANQVWGIKYYQKKHHPKTALLVTFFLYFGFGLRGLLYLSIGMREKSFVYFKSLFYGSDRNIQNIQPLKLSQVAV